MRPLRKRHETHPEDKQRKPVPFLPNFITTMSLFCGFYSIMFSLKGDFHWAAVLILVAGFIDGLDGRVARMTGTTSEFGKQYDSLSDVIAFGVAPAMMVYLWQLNAFGKLGFIATFLFVACGALRLARFNIDTSGSLTHFTGLPIPVAAAGVVSTYLLTEELTRMMGPLPELMPVAVLLGVYVLSFLMVSSIPYPSFKHVHYIKAHPFQLLVAGVLLLVVVALAPELMLFALAMTFIVGGALWSGVSYLIQARTERKGMKGGTHEGISGQDHHI
ncbi:MAG TPA: CDP-diacylglycerol--serine O-phosphatidyltransferase [Deltaproteobacteria bacterium]|nr:CDP-diacylglycerol--serine O-phosphatidyltransferase [Deltaproteobacteria bacterium]HQI82215.1 CDP-diacylglycerol--serine O-phosphatidyltransferase [Deltaproteobacteria bacterium]